MAPHENPPRIGRIGRIGRIAATALALVALAPSSRASAGEVAPAFEDANLQVVDEVDCGDAGDPHPVTQSPAGASAVTSVLATKTRVMANTGDARYFAYVLGKGKGLVAGKAYVLEVEYPEDAPRSFFVVNRGAETTRGLATGPTLGDVYQSYGNQDHESIDYPLSGKTRTFRMLFRLHDRTGELVIPRDGATRARTPDDGFWVAIAQSKSTNAPLSKGAAVSRIRLLAVKDEAKLALDVHYPPASLPRRHLWFREEMADGVVADADPSKRGLDEPTDWFEHKAKLMQFLGMNTYGKDLLEFGSNQGWDSGPFGGNEWYYQTKFPDRWQKMLAMLEKYPFEVLPYYEYSGSKGSKGLGFEKRCKTLGGADTYTHITWSETANADVTDPDTLEDAKKLLDATIAPFSAKTKFLGAWFRTRVSNLPISFSDRCLGIFAKEANGGAAVDRAKLKADETLRKKYYAWWYGKRRDFLLKLRDHLRSVAGGDATLFFTAYTEEPGPSIPGGIVTDDVARFSSLGLAAQPFDEVVSKGTWWNTALSMPATWGGWEWDHSIPPPDPAAYAEDDGIVFSYPFGRLYSVSASEGFDAFRTKAGLSIVRHFSLNENSMDDQLGYFVSDVDRAGPYSMLAEARAMAFGDPTSIGYLSSSTFNRGFPEYARAFDAAYLALPALPSRLEKGAASHADVIVRSIATPAEGTYLSVVNVGLVDRDDVTVSLPVVGHVEDLVTRAELPVVDGKVTLSFFPGELKALRVTEAPIDVPIGGPDGGVDGGPSGPSASPDGDAPSTDESGGCACRAGGRSTDRASLLGIAVAVALLRRRSRGR